jgi:outer membrane protein assembly factor BamE (lipoprotein component of BamABCDE complex)
VISALLAGALTLQACEARVSQSGAMPDVDVIASIQPDKSTKQDVERVMGSPSSINIYGEETWMYIGEVSEQTAFFERKVDERSVVLITFDKDGVVSAIESQGLEAARAIEPVERTTPTVGKNLTVIEQLLGNINRFRGIGQSDN